MKRRAAVVVVVAVALAACSGAPQLTLDIRLPASDSGLTSVSRLILTAERDGIVVAQSSFGASTRSVSLANLSQGDDTVIALDGVDSDDDVVARGSTCPIDFTHGGMKAPLYFAPTNFFAPTVNTPLYREFGVAVALNSGNVLLAGGSSGTQLVTTSEVFTPGAGTFTTVSGMGLVTPRWHAEAITLPSIGVLVTGGIDQDGTAIKTGELFVESSAAFLSVASGLDARVQHQMVLGVQTDSGGDALITGGAATLDGTPLGTTLLAYVLTNGTYNVSPGPALTVPRRNHAAVDVSTTTNDRALLFGGYDATGQPIDSIEVVDFVAGTSTEIAHLQYARAGATATLIPNIGVLVAGGIGADGNPRGDGELFDLLSRASTVTNMQSARVGHTATLLDDNEVLIAGGTDQSGNLLGTTELFRDDDGYFGFVAERNLTTPRANAIALPLCDESVLITGGGVSAAELYTEPN